MTERLFVLDSPDQLPRFHVFLTKQELPLDVTVRPHSAKRSNAQNARLWKLHTLAAEVTGCTPARMHEDMLCEHFGYTEKRLPSGDLERIPNKRSSQRDKKTFNQFMEVVENFYATELGVWLSNDDQF